MSLWSLCITACSCTCVHVLMYEDVHINTGCIEEVLLRVEIELNDINKKG